MSGMGRGRGKRRGVVRTPLRNHGLKMGGLAGRVWSAAAEPGAALLAEEDEDAAAAAAAAERNEGSTKELAVMDVDTLPSAFNRLAPTPTPAAAVADDACPAALPDAPAAPPAAPESPGKTRAGDRVPESPMPRVLAVCPSEYDCTSENLTLLVTGAASPPLPPPSAVPAAAAAAPPPTADPAAAAAAADASGSNRFDVLRMLRSWRPLLSAGGRNAAASIDSTVDGWKKRDV